MHRHKYSVYYWKSKENSIKESSLQISQSNYSISIYNIFIGKDTHDSIEDAKIALALARLRIETLDHFAVNMFTPTSAATPDVLL